MATVRTGLAGTPDLGRPEQPELGRSQPPTICRVVAVESISTRFTFLFRSPFVSLLLRCSFVPPSLVYPVFPSLLSSAQRRSS